MNVRRVLKHENLFGSSMPIYVNTVNCVGVMGKGIALEFKDKFPEYFQDYVQKCKDRKVVPGQSYVYYETNRIINPDIIISMPTKNHWRNPSKYEWAYSCMDTCIDLVNSLYGKNPRLNGIAMPIPGCGNGGLDKRVVLSEMLNRLKNLNPEISVEIYDKSHIGKEIDFYV